tara:strand:+ start:765 stop:1109 length:345 start_codon:yes stop_codon:yes gene_type:complete
MRTIKIVKFIYLPLFYNSIGNKIIIIDIIAHAPIAQVELGKNKMRYDKKKIGESSPDNNKYSRIGFQPSENFVQTLNVLSFNLKKLRSGKVFQGYTFGNASSNKLSKNTGGVLL